MIKQYFAIVKGTPLEQGEGRHAFVARHVEWVSSLAEAIHVMKPAAYGDLMELTEREANDWRREVLKQPQGAGVVTEIYDASPTLRDDKINRVSSLLAEAEARAEAGCPAAEEILNRVHDAVVRALGADSDTGVLSTADARWLLANTVPPSDEEPPLIIPFGVLTHYPLALVSVVTALWEIYMEPAPSGQLRLTTPVEPLLKRLGKDYGEEEALRQLEKVLHDLYRFQKIGYQKLCQDGVDTLIVWLTPDVLKRARAYKESLRPHA